MMNMKTLAAALCCCILASCAGPKNGAYSFQILTTNDVHGTFFDSTYVGGNVKKSLMAVKRTVDSVRTAVGKENVILIDAAELVSGFLEIIGVMSSDVEFLDVLSTLLVDLTSVVTLIEMVIAAVMIRKITEQLEAGENTLRQGAAIQK